MNQAEKIVDEELTRWAKEKIEDREKEDKRDKQLGRPDKYDRQLWREREKLGYR